MKLEKAGEGTHSLSGLFLAVSPICCCRLTFSPLARVVKTIVIRPAFTGCLRHPAVVVNADLPPP
ncbi:hypothetical protein [Citrobacter sp.]|uniref:hypothetical protein n=1 Tax=Citrobacter sp. TaxID=1896336 RepID=UPI0028FE7905|nr:hypothetical protein [Citrobacter sp.]MDU1874564.1 hypothetical protein [Citrobacter sp.]